MVCRKSGARLIYKFCRGRFAPLPLWLGAALTAFLAAAPSPAAAQSFQCQIPRSVSVPRISRDGPVRRLPVTGYLLALTWSPEFCRTREGESRHRRQCSGDAGRFGFVVHGLWPESGRSWPQWCPAPRPPAAAMRANMCLSPSARLLARQWAKHGSCMTGRAETYFKVTRILFNSLRWPDFDALSRRRGLTAGHLREWFTAANRGWRADAVGIKLNERGWLEELRLCYNRRFLPTRCAKGRFGAKDNAEVKIWRGL